MAKNPYATPDPGPRDYVQHVPTKKFIVSSGSPNCLGQKARGFVLTVRGWVREEEGHNG